MEDTVETFTYFVKGAVAKGIAYVTLVQYGEALDPVIDGE